MGMIGPVLKPYIVNSIRPTGAIIICPGGAYGMLAEHEGEPIALWLNRIGISAFVLNYRVAPYKHPIPMLDAQRAIRFLRYHFKTWNIDASRIGIMGFSAGGHLASTVGTHFDKGQLEDPDPVERQSSRPDVMIACYPVISLGEIGHYESMVNLLGEFPADVQRQHLSNELQVSADTPAAFLWHTADDEAVPVEHSLLFAQALSRHKVPFELHIYESGPHGMGLAENKDNEVNAANAVNADSVRTWTSLCGTWLKKRGY
nr:alpha/beta hydrolase [Paenibacillus eucommiae]